MQIGFHASHEQFAPSELLRLVQAAEASGFQAAMCSDHLFPWSERQGHSGFAWSWLGAALQATSLPFGVVTAPGYRYHPTITAHAGATLAEMYPGRFWVALGSGEALNEHVVGGEWPPKPERNARLRECAEVIRALWAGETVTRRGLVDVVEAKVYDRPAQPPPIVGAAITAETAGWVATWADALITINHPDDETRKVVEAFRERGGENKPVYLQVHLSFAGTDDGARHAAWDQWRTNTFASSLLSDLRLPANLDDAAQFVRPKDMDGHVRISADVRRHVDWLHEDAELGFAGVYLHNVGPNQREFVEAFGERVLPELVKL